MKKTVIVIMVVVAAIAGAVFVAPMLMPCRIVERQRLVPAADDE